MIEKKAIEPETIPAGSQFRCHKDFIVQDIIIAPYNTRYRLKVYETPGGAYATGKRPIHLNGKHFGPPLVEFVLYQHHHCHVTQPLLLERLREFATEGVLIGSTNDMFDEILTQSAASETLNLALKRFYNNKSELLLVSERPDIPLHSNSGVRCLPA